MQEPSVLDFVKAKLTPWRNHSEDFATALASEDVSVESTPEEDLAAAHLPRARYPWRLVLALLFAFVAQRVMEPPDQYILLAVILYAQAALFVVWAYIKDEWHLPVLSEPEAEPMPMSLRPWHMLIGLALALIAFAMFGDNRFTTFNVLVWLVSLILIVLALWQPGDTISWWRDRISSAMLERRVSFAFTPWTFLFLAAVALVVFFRFYRLNGLPGEMFSDQAEKLLDVSDVLNGQTSIFFPRNTGREPFQFYLTALIVRLFGTGLTYASLKIGTITAGLLTLPFIYKLGKEYGNRWTGLAAFVLAGIAYWPNIISRVGLRFPFYPLFTAPALYFLVRGLRYRRRNDFIWAGIALGIGLNGYSPMRVVPLVILVAVGLYLLHRHSQGNRMSAVWALIALAFVALILFLPLLRFWLADTNETFAYRMLTRMGTEERGYPGVGIIIFLDNLWRAAVMFFYSNGNTWVNSIPNRPALDVVTAGLYFLGTVLLVIRYVRQRHWMDLFLLVSVPLLMLPSSLSLAFPEENPSLNRAGAAIIPVFITAAFALETGLRSLAARLPRRSANAWVGILAGLLLLVSAQQNFDLVFHKYHEQYMAGVWNNSEIGKVIRAFDGAEGSVDSAYIVPYPYWVDTRLVGFAAGYPGKDFALWPEQFADTKTDPQAKLFVLYPDDEENTQTLRSLFPNGSLYRYDAEREGKDFMLFFVPAEPSNLLQTLPR